MNTYERKDTQKVLAVKVINPTFAAENMRSHAGPCFMLISKDAVTEVIGEHEFKEKYRKVAKKPAAKPSAKKSAKVSP